METSLDLQPSVFPEPWDAPIAPGLPYSHDPMHTPYPVSPMEASIKQRCFSPGFATGMRELGVPFREHQFHFRNFYQFERWDFDQPATPEEADELNAVIEGNMQREVGRLRDRWQSEHFPRIAAGTARLRAMAVNGASNAELLMMLDELEEIQRDLWVIHFRIAFPMLTALQLFDEFYEDLFDDGQASDLLVGVSSASVKAGLALGDLAETVRDLGLEPLFRDTAADALPQALAASEEGRTFLAALDNYLETYGFRQDLYEFRTPTWREEPSYPLAMVRGYLISGYDARAAYESQVQSAAAATERARARLSAYPEAVRGQFEALLDYARQASFLQEEHNFYIDQHAVAHMRLFFLGVGQRLVDDGILASPEDIFMLTNEELRALLGAARMPAAEVQTLVARRRDQLHQARTLVPPPFLGTQPPGPPPVDNPLTRATGRFFGGPPREAEAPNQLKGAPASRGVMAGRARVARTLEEATALRQGEILIAITTMPAWTPLFGVAAAVVTETGGPLSHCAIVAREYGIPAVVGAHGATRTIRNGQMVTVDGDRGVVTIAD